MNRRPFLKLLGANLIGLPLFANSSSLIAATSVGASRLAKLLQEGQIESVASFRMHDLPQQPHEVQSGEFTACTKRVYFYQQRQYCFQVFEKIHPIAGVLELMVPFWKKQRDGSWQKIATLNSFGIEALEQAMDQHYAPAQLLPLNKEAYNSYSCQAGLLHTQTRIGMENQAHTEIRITTPNEQVWTKDFVSTSSLPRFF